MASFTSVTNGNWNDGATWGNSSPGTEGTDWPGNGDTATVDTGDTVTVTANQIVGTSPAPGTAAVSINATGLLIIAEDVIFRVRGDVLVSGGSAAERLRMEAGSSWIFDGSLASSPSTAAYQLKLGTIGSFNPHFNINGTSGNRCTFTSDSGGANGYLAGTTNTGSIDAEFCDFSDLGSASVPAISCGLSYAAYQKFVDCTFDSCGRISNAANYSAESFIVFQRTHFTNGLHATDDLHLAGSNALTTGTRLIDACSFEKRLGNSSGFLDFTITDNYMHAGFSASGSAWDEFSGNFVRDPNQGSNGLRGSMADCYWLENHADNNPHGCSLFLLDADASITGNVFEHTGTGNPGVGDLIVFPTSPTNPRTATITGNILLPNAAGHTPGKIVGLLGGSNVTVVVEHNTYYTEGSGETAVAYGETYAGHAGMISHFRSNLAWGPGSSGLKLNQSGSAGTPTDTVDPDFTDYNAGWGLQAGSEGGGYNKNTMTDPMFTGTRGVDWAANDIDGVDPGFVDSTRNLGAWGQANEGTDGSVAQALAVLQADPTKIAGMIAWVRGGFVVTNLTYATAGHDSTPPGAMGYEAASTGNPAYYYQQLM